MSGFFTGVCAIIVGINYGLPLWALILMYPLAGSLGCLAFIARGLLRNQSFSGYQSGHSNVQMFAQNR